MFFIGVLRSSIKTYFCGCSIFICCHFGHLLLGDLFHLEVWVTGARLKPVSVAVEYCVIFVANLVTVSWSVTYLTFGLLFYLVWASLKFFRFVKGFSVPSKLFYLIKNIIHPNIHYFFQLISPFIFIFSNAKALIK